MDFTYKLKNKLPGIPWSVKNEARMHDVNNIPPYSSSVDAISKFTETATALGVKLDDNNDVILTAPCGIEDAINLELKPTPFFTETPERDAINAIGAVVSAANFMGATINEFLNFRVTDSHYGM